MRAERHAMQKPPINIGKICRKSIVRCLLPHVLQMKVQPDVRILTVKIGSFFTLSLYFGRPYAISSQEKIPHRLLLRSASFHARSAAGICLESGFQIAIYWGPALNLIYNDLWS